MAKLKHGITASYSVHGWMEISLPDDVDWHWLVRLPGSPYMHWAAQDCRSTVEQIVFPHIIKDAEWVDPHSEHPRYYDKKIMNKWIANELNKLGYMENVHWGVVNRPPSYDSVLLFSTLPVRTAFMKILNEVMKK